VGRPRAVVHGLRLLRHGAPGRRLDGRPVSPPRRLKRHELGVAHFPFFRSLSTALCTEVLSFSRPRTFERGELIRGMTVPGGDTVHVVIGGIVVEETVYHEVSAMRFRYEGHVLGDTEIFADPRAPLARAVSQVGTMAMSLDRMRTLAGRRPALMKAIGMSMAERLRTNEKIYGLQSRTPEQRVCTLLLELAEASGYPFEEGRRLDGPSQSDIAQALTLSRATIENVLRTLRQKKVVRTEYRAFVFPDLARLRKLATTNAPVAAPASLA
ncbi:Crp/Fnr family transcriptional regulator, partial [Streptomyces sp. T-3]|nr:Crp/Fnr family transcriptional regulator [Streptomyces sp. T-3]